MDLVTTITVKLVHGAEEQLVASYPQLTDHSTLFHAFQPLAKEPHVRITLFELLDP